jgi:acyl carrier protein
MSATQWRDIHGMTRTTQESVDEIVRALIVENFLFDEGELPLSADDSLVEHGVIDSTGVLELVMMIEDVFGIKVADEDVVPENLDSINRLTAYIQRTCRQGTPEA